MWERTTKLSEIVAEGRGVGGGAEFDALLYPGGLGPAFDLATDAGSQVPIAGFAAAGKPVAAVCNGAAALAGVVLPPSSTPGEGGQRCLVAGKRVTSFSNAEEGPLGVSRYLSFLPEDRLRERGALYEKAAEPRAAHVVVEDGGRLITGQNPESSRGVGEALAEALGL